jgi:hypothetical protein
MHALQTQAVAILCSQLFVQSISPKALIAKRNSSVVVHFNRSTRDNPTLPTEQYWRIVEVTSLLLAAALGTVGLSRCLLIAAQFGSVVILRSFCRDRVARQRQLSSGHTCASVVHIAAASIVPLSGRRSAVALGGSGAGKADLHLILDGEAAGHRKQRLAGCRDRIGSARRC